MYAGKSRQLIFLYGDITKNGVEAIAIRPKFDTRTLTIISRNGTSIPSIEATADEIYSIGKNKKFIFIDEFHFFDKEIINQVSKLLNENKTIVLSGLDMNFLTEEFENYSLLKEIATREIKMTAICFECGQTAKYSKKTSNNSDILELDTLDEGKTFYFSSCLKDHEVKYE
jgi:thymidine kinase